MKITKEEKSLYNFLNIMFTAFGKSQIRNTIVGRGNRCYFFTDGYIGIFEDEDRDTMVGGNYDFKRSYFELKQTPSKTFVLDEIVIEDTFFDKSIENSILLANKFYDCNTFVCELEKDYEFKLAKIALETERWLKDSDVKYLDKLKGSIVFKLEDNIIVKSSGLTKEDCLNVTTVLVFVGEFHPNTSDSTQQKMNADEPILIEETSINLIENSTDKEGESLEEDIMDDDIYPTEMEDDYFDKEGYL